jgi:drug/metabolite transporter (DMT)-like permease
MKTAVVLSVAVVANSVGSVCLARGMKSFPTIGAEGAAWLFQATAEVFSNPWIISGILLLVIFLSAYMAALSWADLSFVLPATAPGYILTAILSRIFLEEQISPMRWAGTIFIVAGTWLVARTYSPQDAPARDMSSREAAFPERM